MSMSFASSSCPNGLIPGDAGAHAAHAGAGRRQLEGQDVRRGLTALLRRRVPPQEVEDIAQTVLCDALAAGHVPSDPEEFRRWLTGIARHKIADFHRRAARGRARTAGGEGAEHVAASPTAFEEREVLENLLAESRTRRDAETMEWLVREHDGERLIDIASEEGLPAPVVRQRVSRFRRALRARWVGLFALALVVSGGGAYVVRGLDSPPELATAPRPHPSIAADPAASSAPVIVPTPVPTVDLAREIQGDWVIQTVTPARPLSANEKRLSDVHTRSALVRVSQREIVLESKGLRLVWKIKTVTKTSTGLHVTLESEPGLVDAIDVGLIRDDRGPRLDAALHGARLSGTIALRRPIL
jgi:DNA-directed RNA polymerase specialized sigma24 family protein